MNLITEWLRKCSNCFNNKKISLRNSDYYINIENLSKECQHQLNEKNFICKKCFQKFFFYDRFIIEQLFVYLKQENNLISIQNFSLFAQRIIHWHEYSNHLDFILQLLHIIFFSNFHENFIYQLIEDAFFFTIIQSDIDINNYQLDFLKKFFHYFNQLNPNQNSQTYFYLIKRLLPWAFISIHKWLKICLVSSIKLRKKSSNNFHFNLDLSFLWYLTNWLTYNKIFLNEYNPIKIFEKIFHQEYLTNLYDSDKHGYSIVTLCQLTYYIDGPFLLMFFCQDEKIFAILLDGKLLDSTKSYDGQSSLCLQLSPQFLILERGPSMLYWNIKKRSDGPLAIRIGHNGIIRVSFDINLEYIHHPEGSSRIHRIQIYKFGPYKTPLSTPLIRKKSQYNEYNQFSVDAHKLAESIGIHLFT